MSFRPALLVPHYNHHRQFRGELPALLATRLPLIVVDDGSDAASLEDLKAQLADVDSAQLVRHESNRGKGAAMITGFDVAREGGYSHVVQVDADGQHDIDDIPRLLKLAEAQPGALISGRPVYDDDLPGERRWGRKFTHLWVALETLSLRVEDAMCGLRVYPLEALKRLTDRYSFGLRMQFDTEVLVKADWSGLPLLYLPTRVRYPEDGLSHFDYVRDNWDITRMHTRLVLGMLPRAPWLLWRQLRRLLGRS